jgi:hypothetical protein
LDHPEVLGVNAGLGGGGVVEQLNLLEEARLLVFVEALAGVSLSG